MNVISISFWGSEPMYWEGALANARVYRSIYPGWHLRFYTDTENAYTSEIARHGCELRLMANLGGIHGMFWRFLAASDPDVDAVIVRDSDSRLNLREAAAVQAWLQSGKAAHVMRDHPMHLQWPMLGGMWGVRGGVIPDMESKIASWGRWQKKLDDMLFLKDVVWPLIAKNCLQHNRGFSPFGGLPFPSHPPCDCDYVGEVYSADGKKSALPDALQNHQEIGRNSPCPCGSGRKFKNCGGGFFWGPDGTQISPKQFSDRLFRKVLR